MSDPDAYPDTELRSVRQPVIHDSAGKHVTGTARYVDDMPEPANLLHVAVGGSDVAHGRLNSLDLGRVKAAPGVVAVLTGKDIPGENDVGPVIHDDPVFACEEIVFLGQPLFAVVAENRRQARQAVLLAEWDIEPLPAILDVDAALEANATVLDDYALVRGQSDYTLSKSTRHLTGTVRVGGQEHFYLEGQVSMALPQEDGDMLVYCSTQHPSEVQHGVARVLGVASHAVTVESRRMGGGFGGKETQGAQWAAIAALGALKTGRACKIRLDRDDDMVMTGKRHDFRIDYHVGFDNDGVIEAVEIDYAARCGHSADLSAGICDRT
ncbi:MAG: molybdopterin-dependent oxidoreductase, partial [Fimbriimonadaceae bacterium]|nr:molybdopterin-dependent oxidoreductase [Alphaproteobacteria bacterium]